MKLKITVMASSMKLEYPLNDALPSADHARDRLLAKIFSFRKGEKERTGTTDEDFALLYSYGEWNLTVCYHCGTNSSNF